MKPRTILACLFAAYGAIQVIYGVFNAAAGMTLAPDIHPTWSRVAVYALFFLPVIGGTMFIWFARPLGAFTARMAGVADDALFEGSISASTLLNVVLAAIGAYVGITEGGAMIRLLILSYEKPLAGGSDLYAVPRLIPDASPIIAHAVVVLMAAALALRSRAIARALVGKVDDA